MGIGRILEQIVLPPGGFVLMSILGLVLMQKTRRTGIALAASGLILLYLFSMPATAIFLFSLLEPNTAITEKQLTDNQVTSSIKKPQAIVILGSGRNYNTLEFERDVPSAFALERIRYGVWLARRTLLPVLVSGGFGDSDNLPEAELMKQVIEGDYALPVRWVEPQSRNTYESAKYSSELLMSEGIESIYLVTHANHMKRSVMSFEKFGLVLHPASTVFRSTSQRSLGISDFLPKAKSLYHTSLVLHECVGIIWYWIRY